MEQLFCAAELFMRQKLTVIDKTVFKNIIADSS